MVFSLWVTDYCNLNCSYCYINKWDKSEMRLGMEEDIISFIKSMLTKTGEKKVAIKFFGGEPLLNIDFIKTFINKVENEILDSVDGRIDYLLTTNGVLLDEHNLKFLKENNVQISLSIDGDADENSKGRISLIDNYWSKLDKNIDLLLTELPTSVARMTITSKNYKNLEQNIDYLISRGFKKIKPIPDYFDEEWTDENFLELEEIFFRLKNKFIKDYKSKDIIITLFNSDDLMKGYIGCSGGYKSFSIASNGDIYPCTYVVKEKQFLLGNIKDYKNFKIVKHVTDHSKRVECLGCKYLKGCSSGRCIYVNYKLTGDFYKTSGFLCEYEDLLVRLNS